LIYHEFATKDTTTLVVMHVQLKILRHDIP
jgi:hypothetical protein